MNCEKTMPAFHPTSMRAQRGFSLAELMVAATIGLLILAGMSTLFVNNTRAQGEIEKANRQVENGRFAVQTLSSDLRNAGFYGEFDPTVLDSPAALPDPCAVTITAVRSALPLPVQGIDNATGAYDCLPGLRADTDVIVVRRTATCVAGAAGCEPLAAGGPFFQAALCANLTQLGSGSTADYYALDTTAAPLDRLQRDCTTAAAIRRYLTHVYYLADNDRDGDGIPTLKRAELGADGAVLGYSTVALVNGIDDLQFEYGLDTSADGVADRFAANPATGCADAACAVANWRQVVSVKLSLLSRNIETTQGYTDAMQYKLGRDADGEEIVVGPKGDGFKRHVFQSQVALPNLAGRRTP